MNTLQLNQKMTALVIKELKRIKLIGVCFLVIILNAVNTRAQSSLLVTNISDGNSSVVNSYTLYVGVGNNVGHQVDFNMKNISTSTKTYKIRRYEDLLNVGASAYFCFDAMCYTPATFVSPTTLTLTANQDAVALQRPIQIHYDEAPTAGTSSIRYKIYDPNNLADEFFFTIAYNNPLSVKNNDAVLFSASNVYPNPATDKAFINLQSSHDVNVTVSITNALGSIVSSKKIELFTGKNTITLDSENLSSGIYMVSIASGKSNITKKITIN